MALDTFKCNYLTPLHFKGLTVEDLCTCTAINPVWKIQSQVMSLLLLWSHRQFCRAYV